MAAPHSYLLVHDRNQPQHEMLERTAQPTNTLVGTSLQGVPVAVNDTRHVLLNELLSDSSRHKSRHYKLTNVRLMCLGAPAVPEVVMLAMWHRKEGIVLMFE